MRARVTAVLLLPFLVLVGTGGARASFFCREERVLRASCCCPKGEPPQTPVVERTSCCDVKTLRAPAAEPRRVSDDASFAQLPAPAPVVAVAAPPPRLIIRPFRDAHPPVGPPLIVAKQSFLL
jgi:hypothetical protein